LNSASMLGNATNPRAPRRHAVQARCQTVARALEQTHPAAAELSGYPGGSQRDC
jgi:hypothetical protein